MIDKKYFEDLVVEAIAELPEYFRNKMENIAIHIEDFPTRSILRNLGQKTPYSLLGLYQGVPITHRGIHYRNVMPDRILIYREPILKKNKSPREIKNDIKRVVLHEIGHYFGLNDTVLHAIEKENITNRKNQT